MTASKVMFYYKGDTLVYDAGAFVLAEGSMLDALLAQMPGVKLESNGEIRCNGKRVDNLLLNGRDIFNGKRELMLENLAAYTIKDIAFYDKLGRNGELMGFKTGDELYVMDVRLKREYSHGWIVNAEGGYGSKDRYLAKLFGMWFSDYVSMTAYAGANNLSDSGTPGKDDGAWSMRNMGTGVTSGLKGGLTYNAHGFEERWEVKGNVEATRNITDSRTRTSVENYQSGNDIYSYYWQNFRTRDFKVNTAHEFFAKLGERVTIDVKPEFGYNTSRRRSDNLSASFREKISDLSRTRLLGIYADGSTLADTMINRSVNEMKRLGHGIDGSLGVAVPIKLRNGFWGNMLELSASADYSNDFTHGFERFAINYGAESKPAVLDHRYSRRYPHHDTEVKAGAMFTQYLKKPMGRLAPNYEFKYKEQTRTSDLFMLSDLDGYDADLWALDHRPADGSLTDHFIPSLSEASTITEQSHRLQLSPWLEAIKFRNGSMAAIFWGSASVEITHRHMDYVSNSISTPITRDDVLPNVSAGVSINPWLSRFGWRYNVSYNFRRERVRNLLDLIDRPVVNPLTIYKGNPNLKNSSLNFLTFSADRENAQCFATDSGARLNTPTATSTETTASTPPPAPSFIAAKTSMATARPCSAMSSSLPSTG